MVNFGIKPTSVINGGSKAFRSRVSRPNVTLSRIKYSNNVPTNTPENPLRDNWNKFKNYINEKIKEFKVPKTFCKDDCNITCHTDDNVDELLKNSIGDKPYRIATSGYSLKTDGYEEPTQAFLKSIEEALGSTNTGYVFPPTLDKGSIYDITAQISGLNKDKTLFVTAKDFYNNFMNLGNFSKNIKMKKYIKTPIHVFPTPEIYTKATANASNVLICTGGRKIAVNEIIEALKRKNKVILLHNLNLNNGTYKGTMQEVENAARFFDDLRLSKLMECSNSERQELKSLLEQPNLINDLVRVYLVNDAKSASKAGIRAANFIKKESPKTIHKLSSLPSLEKIKTLSLSELRELSKISGGIELMKKAGIIGKHSTRKEVQTLYGQVRHSQIKTADNQIIASCLKIPQQDGKMVNILKDIPQEILQSPVSGHIHKINWSTINPKVGVEVIQNSSRPVTARKILSEGTLENSLVNNNMNNIPLKYDIVQGSQYIDTTKRQTLTGDGFLAIYSSNLKNKKISNPENTLKEMSIKKRKLNSSNTSAQTLIEDRSFMPADIAKKQYEIITQSGKILPCNYENMNTNVNYKIRKKAGVKLKMAVPSREVVSSEGEILAPNKLYMVDSNGHFYDGNPIERIKRKDIAWNFDTNDIQQVKINNYINKAIKLEQEAKSAEKAGNIFSSNNKLKEAKEFTAMAEQGMTEWVKSAQNPEGVKFFI